MKTKLLLLGSTVALMLSLAVPAALATTAPAVSVKITVTITKKATKFSLTGGRRGWAAHFTVRNADTKPHQLEIGGLKSKVVKPGGKSTIGAYLEDRGSFVWKVDKGGPNRQGLFKVV
jgi:hypothetical protein